jgi:hypothetical protein
MTNTGVCFKHSHSEQDCRVVPAAGIQTLSETASINLIPFKSPVVKTNLMHYLSSVYFFNQAPHIPGIFVAHRHEVYSIYIQKLVRVVYIQYTS